MVKPFLKLVAEYIFEKHKDSIEKLCLVLPNKRGALFLKKYLSEVYGKTIWLPTIISAEELITELSGLKTPEEIDLICHLYDSYKTCYGPNAESFDSFAKWGQLILQDFNEIDRYLADSEQLYENLKDIKVIENWSLGEENLSDYQQNYLQFMTSLGAIYKNFSEKLLQNKWAYQGLAYKYAVKNLDSSIYVEQFEKLIFCGFNALNAAELKIIGRLTEQKKAELLWDADTYYLKDKNQEAGSFLRKNFEYFKEKDPYFIQSNFTAAKSIQIISVPKQIGQAQVVKQSLQKLIDANVPLDKVAVVLANEKLLWPVLQQLPAAVEHVNITMEYPLKYTSTYGLIDLILQIQLNFEKQNKTHKTIYHLDLVGLLRQPLFLNYLQGIGVRLNASHIINQINGRNLSFISQKNLQQLFGESYQLLHPMLSQAANVAKLCELILSVLQTCIFYFSEKRPANKTNLELEYLQIIFKNFNRLNDTLSKYPHFNDIRSFRQLYLQVVGNASAPFIGEPLRGLQIMGVLETRTLDFEHVILVNVNEGVLPSGKSISSFIPNDLKQAFGMPLYLEKDAIYAYHFYRLLQKAESVTITYDSETDSFGKGEKSRFLTQLQLELNAFNSDIKISEEVASYPEFPEELKNEIRIEKNTEVLKAISKKALSSEEFGGLSPSGLISFKECSLKFYFRYGARLKETTEVEESAEANTFGSILHLCLETLYKDFIGTVIQKAALLKQLSLVDATVNSCFMSFFDNNPPQGKSLLQVEVIKVYVKKLLHADLAFIENLTIENHHLSLLGLEREFSSPLTIKINGKDETIYLKGKMDRIDSYKGFTRIIDYKSSVKDSDKFVFEGFEKLFHDSEYNKQFQLFMYAWLLYKNQICDAEKVVPCIVPFKVFLKEPKYLRDGNKNTLVFSAALLTDFENELIHFIESIFENGSCFEQTEDKTICEYCAYNRICNLQP